MSDKKCQSIEHPNLMEGGWGCCKCNTYNGGGRIKCKYCDHQRCLDQSLETDDIPAVSFDKNKLN